MCKTPLKTSNGTSSALLIPVDPQGARKVSLVKSKRASPISSVAIYAMFPKVTTSVKPLEVNSLDESYIAIEFVEVSITDIAEFELMVIKWLLFMAILCTELEANPFEVSQVCTIEPLSLILCAPVFSDAM